MYEPLGLGPSAIWPGKLETTQFVGDCRDPQIWLELGELLLKSKEVISS